MALKGFRPCGSWIKRAFCARWKRVGIWKPEWRSCSPSNNPVMRLHALASVLIALGLGGSTGNTKFIQHETRQVPIERLFNNFQQRLARDTNDLETTYR